MPSKKKKYNARFPPARIKKIMQSDEEVGKVAQVVPVIISKSLEIFIHQLLKSAQDVTKSRKARTLTPTHLKTAVLSKPEFTFLREMVQAIPDVTSGVEDESSVASSSGHNGNEESQQQQVPSTSSMGRGRRPNQSASSSTATSTGATVPRSRGRPRKRPPDESFALPSSSSSSTVYKAPYSSTRTNSSIPPKKRRGRPPKVSDSEDYDMDDEEEEEEDDEDDEEDHEDAEEHDDEEEEEEEESGALNLSKSGPAPTSFHPPTATTSSLGEDDDYDNC